MEQNELIEKKIGKGDLLIIVSDGDTTHTLLNDEYIGMGVEVLRFEAEPYNATLSYERFRAANNATPRDFIRSVARLLGEYLKNKG